jgi:hypothetical protein
MAYGSVLLLAFTASLIHPAFSSTLQLPSTNKALENSTQSNTNNHLSLPINDPRPAVCFEPSLFSAQLAQTYDCLDAIMKLPISSQEGDFYSDPHQVTHNPFNLPVSKTHGSCNATVSIRAGKRDKSSWISVSVGANQLAQRCSVGYYPRGKSGGVMYTGSDSLIQIVLVKVGGIPVPPLLYTKSENGTEVVLDTS